MDRFDEEQLQKLKDFFHMKETPEERELFLIRKTQKYAKILSHIPGLLFVGIGNSVAMNTAHKDSDIDLFIVASKERLWTVRILTTLLFSLLWQRKTKHHHRDRFCLSFFVTEKAMDFASFAIQNDIYLYFWVLYMKPIVDLNDTYSQFLEANSSWINMNEYQDILTGNQEYIAIKGEKDTTPSSLGNKLESFLKTHFLPKTLRHFELLWKPYGVIIGEDILKFHDKDMRKEVREKIFSEEDEV